jgi:hypothetical protein
MIVLSRAAIAAIHGVMIHGYSARRAHDFLPSSEGRTSASAHAALNEAAQKVVRDRLAIAGVMLPQPLLHLVEQLRETMAGTLTAIHSHRSRSTGHGSLSCLPDSHPSRALFD